MERLLEHQSLKDHYQAHACVVWCFDGRFSKLYETFLKKNNWPMGNVDLVCVAGGAKDLASPEKKEHQEYVLHQIAKSITLHKTPLVALMVHSQCGAYGKYFNDAQSEQAFYDAELQTARHTVQDFLSIHYPEVSIATYFADFEGLLQSSHRMP